MGPSLAKGSLEERARLGETPVAAAQKRSDADDPARPHDGGGDREVQARALG
jgi:hypothetical protein